MFCFSSQNGFSGFFSFSILSVFFSLSSFFTFSGWGFLGSFSSHI